MGKNRDTVEALRDDLTREQVLSSKQTAARLRLAKKALARLARLVAPVDTNVKEGEKT